MADIFKQKLEEKLIALMNETGYNITQENGQRKFGPPPGWNGNPPPKGSEIFIGKLPRDIFEDELVPLCRQFGEIYELRLMMDFNGLNRGYAFVTYLNNEDAMKAIKHLDDFEIREGRRIGVCKSIDNCRLFVGGIPKDKTKDEIMAEISKYTEGVTKVILYSSIVDKSKNRGFAFVEYESHRAAAMARRKLISDKIKLFDHEIAVDWAQPEAQVEEETMRRFLKSIGKRHMLQPSLVTVLYVRNLSNSTTEEQLLSIFSMGGALKIERVKKLRDFAFIHYCRREDAESARERFDGMILDGCVIEVTWAKPPETQKLKLMDKNIGAYLYRQLNFSNLDHSFDLNSSPLSSFSMYSRQIARPRVQMSSLSNISNTYPLTKPIQLLAYICNENSWESPVFQVSRIDSDPAEIFYVCWVIIPNLPVHARRFMSDKFCHSPEEAKHYAACCVLRKLGVIDADIPYMASPQPMPMPNVFSNIPKSYINSSNTSTPKCASNIGLYSPPKYPHFQSIKAPVATNRPFFCERGQGDAGNFLSNIPPMDTYNSDEIENCPLLDPETPIEHNSLLDLLSSLAVANNVDIPLFNKPKL